MSKAKIISVANQKGGVGKTTTSVNMAACLAEMGKRVILIDLDPQGNASTGLGIDEQQRHRSSYDVLTHDSTAAEAVLPTAWDNLRIIPATSDLASADIHLSGQRNRLGILRNQLQDIVDADYVIIDCPPALGLLTLNAMVASDSVLVPLQTEFFALEGLSQLLLTVREVRQSANPALRIEGIVLTMFDARNNLSQHVEADARATLGDLVFDTAIPRNVRLSESPSFAKPIIHYDRLSKGATAYITMAEEFLKRQTNQKGAA